MKVKRTHLIEDGSFAAEEGPHALLGHSFGVLIGQAHVEDMAVVGGVSIVTELASFTAGEERGEERV